MMEVKQNTAVDLSDLLVPPKGVDGTDELDDAVMTDLSENTDPRELRCNLTKSNETSNNGVVGTTNGDDTLSSLMDMEPSEATALDDVAVSTELEDALLAEDDVLPIVATKATCAAVPTVAVDDILADKVETSNSTTSSSNVRDPGDDLDTLLSKINDIVEDCLENEVGSTAVVQSEVDDLVREKEGTVAGSSLAVAKIVNLDESVMIVEDPTNEESNVATDEVVEKEPSATVSAAAVEIREELTETVEINSEEQSFATEREAEVACRVVEIESIVAEKTDVDASVESEEAKDQVRTVAPALSKENISTEEEVLAEEQAPTEKAEHAEECKSLDKKDEEEFRNDCPVKEKQIVGNNNEDSLDNNKDGENSLDDIPEEGTPDEVLAKNNESLGNNKEEDIETSGTFKESLAEVEDPKSNLVSTNVKEEDKTDDKEKGDKVDNDDSDDEIVFYVDDKPTDTEENLGNKEPEEASAAEETTMEENAEKEKPAPEDDTVVILDDDEEGNEEKKVVENQTSEGAHEKSQSQSNLSEHNEKPNAKEITELVKESLDMDNSDNARDEFATDKTAIASAGRCKHQENEETNSNCSSSSNLLLEAKTTENSGDGPTQEDNDNENEEEDDDGDVELIENESKEAENSSEKGEELAPPAKRQRLSEDDSQVSTNTDETSSKSHNMSETIEKKSEIHTETASPSVSTSNSTSTSTSLKRTHNVIELEIDDKSNDSKASTESLTKKARTDKKTKDEAVVAPVSSEDEKMPKEEEGSKGDAKDVKKMVPSYKPIPLYPPPKYESLKWEKTFNLEFLKKFRKSFDKMTKQDLEEMVLQKVVEAIIHKSEFAEMRELIEKQEKIISSHRTKITELSKQFRDLEMVHNRVVKDIDQRNSQFIMPVKITRAVGLQVYIPNKKSSLDTSSNSSTTSSNIPAVSPQRQVTSASHSNLTSPQRPIVSSQSVDAQVRTGSNLSSAVTAAITNAVRRGCAQKVTPTRPVPSASITSGNASGSAANTSSVFRSNSNQAQTPQQPRILNKNATATTAVAPTNANAATAQRSRYMENMRMQQQQQQQATASRPTANNQRIVTQPKPPPSTTNVPRRSEPAASGASNNSSTLDSYMNTLSQLTGGNTAVSITPAKPKEKAVIDLTDEDETPAAPPVNNAQPANNGPVNQAQQRRSLPTQSNNANSASQYGRNAPPLSRIPPINLLANSNKNRQAAAQGQKSSNSSFASTISTPPGTSITRINVSANTQNPQRVKYSHPAPLPATPPQAFNPAWKLPPPRPTIRISNLDNGIVISWTMEESMDRHAECVSYQIYAYQETSGPPMADSWRHVGDVKAMLLPMAVTLTQFQEGQRYFFAVRAVDCHQRYGPFSLPKTWS